MIARRDFITLVGGAAATWPLAARAQQAAMPTIGYLLSQAPDRLAYRREWWRQGLEDAGFVIGQNVAVEYRSANNRFERLPALAAELVQRKVTVIVTGGGPVPTLAVKAATSTIPIVFMMGTDPVSVGLVPSLNRPGGNITGVTTLLLELAGKRLDLLRELVPQGLTIGYLHDPRDITSEQNKSEMVAAAQALGRRVVVVEAQSDDDFATAFSTLVREQAAAMVINAGVLFTNNRRELVALAARHRIPALYGFREFALEGGLMSYGASEQDAYRQLGNYTALVLKGTKPADLPILLPTKFEMVINLRAAKALGIVVPPSLLATANEVIE
jgi:putative ABC transport system substrate-binding protein